MKEMVRRSRRSISVFLFFCVLILLGGCYSYSHHIDLNRNGSGTLKVLIEHAQIDFYGGPSEPVRQRDREDCDETSVEWGEIEGVSLQSCQSWIEDFHIFEEAVYSFDHVSRLTTEEWSFSWERQGSYKVFTMDYVTGEEPPTEEDKAATRKEMEGFKGVSFSVTLPKEIADAPGAVVEGRTATWNHTWKEIIDEGVTELHMTARVKLNFWQRLFGW